MSILNVSSKLDLRPDITATNRELDQYIDGLKERNGHMKIWDDIQYPDKYCIDNLVQNNWKILPKEDLFFEGIVSFNKEIFYRADLTGYKRDTTIFHELAHVLYPSNEYWLGDKYNWELVIEWIGRGWRDKPELLRMVLNSFNVLPMVYDPVSAKAFPELGNI